MNLLMVGQCSFNILGCDYECSLWQIYLSNGEVFIWEILGKLQLRENSSSREIEKGSFLCLHKGDESENHVMRTIWCFLLGEPFEESASNRGRSQWHCLKNLQLRCWANIETSYHAYFRDQQLTSQVQCPHLLPCLVQYVAAPAVVGNHQRKHFQIMRTTICNRYIRRAHLMYATIPV